MPVIAPIQFALGVGASGALVDVSTYVEFGDGITKSTGKQDQFRDTQPGTFIVTLSNRDGRFTPNNAASAYAATGTLVTEGMMACLNIGGRLTAGTVLSIQLPADELTWGQIVLTFDDQLGNAARHALSVFVDEINKGATQFLMWPLADVAGTVVPAETTGNGAGLLALGTTNGSVFGAPAATGLNAGTQLTLKDGLTPTNSAVWPTFPFVYPTSSLGAYTFEITPQTGSKAICAVSLQGFPRSLQFGYLAGQFFVRDGDTGTPATFTQVDNALHFVSMAITSVFTTVWTITATLYVDGISRGSIVYGTTFAALPYRAPTGVSLIATV